MRRQKELRTSILVPDLYCQVLQNTTVGHLLQETQMPPKRYLMIAKVTTEGPTKGLPTFPSVLLHFSTHTPTLPAEATR